MNLGNLPRNPCVFFVHLPSICQYLKQKLQIYHYRDPTAMVMRISNGSYPEKLLWSRDDVPHHDRCSQRINYMLVIRM